MFCVRVVQSRVMTVGSAELVLTAHIRRVPVRATRIIGLTEIARRSALQISIRGLNLMP